MIVPELPRRKSDDWSHCPACGGSIDVGYECNKCGRDWLEWVQTRATLREQLAQAREALKAVITAWEHDGEPNALQYEQAVKQAEAALAAMGEG